PYTQFRSLTAAQVPTLTLAQVASIPTSGWLGTLSATARAALTTAQVQALNPVAVDGRLLTAAQFAELTVTQIQGLPYQEFQSLDPAQIPYLTLAQVASIPTMGWFDTLSAADKAALTPTQRAQLPANWT